MKNYKEPIIRIEMLTTENILTISSGLATNESLAKSKLGDAGVLAANVTTLIFDDIISSQQ